MFAPRASEISKSGGGGLHPSSTDLKKQLFKEILKQTTNHSSLLVLWSTESEMAIKEAVFVLFLITLLVVTDAKRSGQCAESKGLYNGIAFINQN